MFRLLKLIMCLITYLFIFIVTSLCFCSIWNQQRCWENVSGLSLKYFSIRKKWKGKLTFPLVFLLQRRKEALACQGILLIHRDPAFWASLAPTREWATVPPPHWHKLRSPDLAVIVSPVPTVGCLHKHHDLLFILCGRQRLLFFLKDNTGLSFAPCPLSPCSPWPPAPSLWIWAVFVPP